MELEKQLRRQIFDARIKNFTNQLDDTASIRRMKRDLARVKTIATERSMGDAEEPRRRPSRTPEPSEDAASEAEETDMRTDKAEGCPQKEGHQAQAHGHRAQRQDGQDRRGRGRLVATCTASTTST